MSLLMLDIDHFKTVNDTYGHLVGDEVLREVGRLLSETLRSTDFTARFGGEEFTVILPQTTEEQARHLAERLRLLIAALQFTHQARSFSITVSIGVAGLQPGALARRRSLLEKADQALYQAKKLGHNQVFSPLMSQPPMERILDTGEAKAG
jgi:diguanylate cyclase (GGDEF)-like protein